MFPLLLGVTVDAKLDAVELLARRLSAASPDAKHPGKAWEIHQEKASFLPGDSPGFLWVRSPKLPVLRTPGDGCLFFPANVIARCGSRAVTALARVWVAPSEARLRTSNACIAVRNPRPSAALDAGRIRGAPVFPLLDHAHASCQYSLGFRWRASRHSAL